MFNKHLELLLAENFSNTGIPVELKRLFEQISNSFDAQDQVVDNLNAALVNRENQVANLESKLAGESSELKQTHQELTRLFNQVHEGFFTRDILMNQYTHMSVGCEKIYGYSISDFFSNNQLWYEVIHPDDRCLLDESNSLLMKGETVLSSYRIIHKNGMVRWIEVKALPYIFNGQLVRVDGVVNDITERKNAEAALVMNERQLDLIYNTVIESIFMISIDANYRYKFVSVNDAFLKTTVVTRDEVIGRYVDELIPSPYLETTLKNYDTARLTKKPVTWEERWSNPKAGNVIGIVTITPVIEEDESCNGIIGSVRNITERVKAEDDYKTSQRNFQSLVNTIDGIVWESDVKTLRIVFISRRAEALLGYPVSEWLNNASFWEEHLHPADREEAVNAFLKNTYEKRSHVLEYRMIAADGREVWFQDNVSFVKSEDGSDYLRGIMVDITETKKAEKIIKDSQERIKLIMSAALDAIICLDVEDKITFWNPQAEAIFGWKATEVIGTSLSALIIPPVYRQRHLKGIQQYLATGEGKMLNALLELSAIRRSGEEFPIELTILPIKQGGEEFFCAFLRDITGRKKAEKQITDSERRYRLLFEQNLAGVYQTNTSGEIINCNQAFAEMLGYSAPQDILYTNMSAHYAVDKRPANFISELQHQGKIANHEVILKTRAGVPIHIIKNISLFKDPATGEDVIYGILIDITERKKAESLLRESEKRYRQIVETAQEGIWMMDEEFTTIFVNKKMGELLESTAAEMMGKSLGFFIHPASVDLMTPLIEQSRRGATYTVDLPLNTRTGHLIWVTVSASPVFNEESVFTGCLAMVTDITNRKLNEERIRRSEANLDLKNKELKRKNTELEQFAYVASHDLQEPLRTTSSFVQLLQQQYKGRLDEKADKYLRFIYESSDRMKVLIKDLLDYSRIGAKEDLESVDCNQIMQDVIADLDKAISEAQAEIEIQKLPVIKGYPTEIQQLFQNLVINAIKFRAPGRQPHVIVGVTTVNGYWQFSFADNGIGIDKAHNDRIFVIFQRLHTRSEYQGSGIGLSHCKKIVELHHGKIWVESTPGKGSTFFFTIPVQNYPSTWHAE